MPELDEMLTTLRDVVIRLNDLDILYMVTGSVAMSTYATARTTMDIDMIIEISKRDSSRFERRFSGDYYVDEQSISRAQDRKSMFNVLNMETGIKVDFIIRKPNLLETQKFERRRLSSLGGVEFYVIGKHDLILSKLDWAKDSYSELQFKDIRNLIESGVDVDKLDRDIETYGLHDVWEAFSEWKIRIAK
ncbi:MAG: hypothetical protein IT173_11350 [Acidobacteria bacterium]|nr:hypothetical protein [Acidobacteriota bacterium]